MDSLRASIAPSENMVHGPGVPGSHDVYTTIDDCYHVVHMEGDQPRGLVVRVSDY